jgi:hypothetical protein
MRKNDTPLRCGDAVEAGELVLHPPGLGRVSTEALADSAAVGAHQAHEPQAADAAAGVAAQIDD